MCNSQASTWHGLAVLASNRVVCLRLISFKLHKAEYKDKLDNLGRQHACRFGMKSTKVQTLGGAGRGRAKELLHVCEALRKRTR